MIDQKVLPELVDEAEYQAALQAARPYFEMEPAEGTPEAADFDTLMLQIDQYEQRRYALGKK